VIVKSYSNTIDKINRILFKKKCILTNVSLPIYSFAESFKLIFIEYLPKILLFVRKLGWELNLSWLDNNFEASV